MSQQQPATHLINFLKAGVSPFHTVEYSALVLEQAGFSALDFKSDWQLEPGKSYYCRTFSGELFAFRIGSQLDLSKGIRMAAAHTDWPALKVKPEPSFISKGYLQANVEVYGGPILNTFFDRPLSIAGKITLRSNDILHPQTRLVDLKDPVCTIPNLAIHMNRQVNEGVAIDKQTQLMPILDVVSGSLNDDDCLLNYIAQYEQIDIHDLLDYELYLYNPENPAFIGLSKQLLSSPRLDNITGVSAIIHGLINSTPTDSIALGVLFDNEEIGSHTKQGADSSMINFVLEKIWSSFGKTSAQCYSDIHDSMIMSIDVGHGYHPNYPAVSDITTFPVLGNGFVIKSHSNQSYAWDCEAVGATIQLCQAYGIPYQRMAKRSSLTGGGTLASLISSHVPIKVVDLGVPLLSMHSSRELMGIKDQESLENAVTHFMSL